MLKSYFVLAYRSLMLNKTASSINIFGLSIAIGCAIVVYLFLYNHWTMDNFHVNGDRIYMVEYVVDKGGEERVYGSSPMPLGPALQAEFPQVERAVRVQTQVCRVYAGDQSFEETFSFAEEGFFDTFTFPLRSGSAEALEDPDAVILSDAIARKFFGDEPADGKPLVLVLENQSKRVFTVRGVAAPFPNNVGFKFSILAGFATLRTLSPHPLSDWSVETRGTFVQLRPGKDIADLASRMDKFLRVYNAARPDESVKAFVFDNLRNPNPSAADVYRRPAYVDPPILSVLFALIPLMMIALSSLNYVNITLGQAGKRAKEIGVRKMMGGSRRQLVLQFLSENILVCLLSLVVGLGLTEGLFVPLMNSLMVVKISLSLAANPDLWLFLVGLMVSVGLASGGYPALVISGLQPVSILRNRSMFGGNSRLARVLLGSQFLLAFSTVIMAVAILMAGSYWKDLPWGYEPDQTLVIRVDRGGQYDALNREAGQNAYVLNTAGAVNHLGESMARGSVFFGQDAYDVLRFDVGAEYFEAMGLRLSIGRLFDERRPHEDARSVVVNRTFVVERHLSDPIGQEIRADGLTFTIVGVLDDFKIMGSGAGRPVVFFRSDASRFNYLVLRCQQGALDEVESAMRSVWNRMYPDSPFSYFRQSTVFDNFYLTYNKVASAFAYLAGLALIIACLGLVGLASQNYARRLKEVSIRKVLGASVRNITYLGNRTFLLILGISGIIATGLCFAGIELLVNETRKFTGSLDLGVTPYAIADLLVLLTAAAAISVQSWKLARTSPADALRNE